MRRFCDLHTHSTASDGSLPPREIIDLAERRRLAGIALTDHDTLAGLAEAARAAEAYPNLRFIPGIEVSAAFPQGTMHILGLCFDPARSELEELARALRQAREERNPRMVEKLQAMGMAVTMEEWLAEAAGERSGLSHGDAKATAASPWHPTAQRVVGRLHLARLLVRKGHARSAEDAFARLIGHGCPGYVDKERLSPAAVISAIHGAGGLAILAHPALLGCENFAQVERIVRSLMHAGLDGLEAYHSDHSELQTRTFLDLARKHSLAVSGGSDFHGAGRDERRLGIPRVPAMAMEGLLARAGGNR